MSRSSATSRTQSAADEVIHAAGFLPDLISSAGSLGDFLGPQHAMRGLAIALHAHEDDAAVMRHLLLRSEVPGLICSSLALALRHLSSAAGSVSPEEPALAAAAHLASFVTLPLLATGDFECFVELATVVQDSGLVAAITTSSAVLLQLIQHPPQQRTCSCAAVLTGTLLMIWSLCVTPHFSTERGSHAIPTAAMLATARLVVAAVRAYPPSAERSRGSSARWAPPTNSTNRCAAAPVAAAAAAAAGASGRAAYFYTRQLKDHFDEEHLLQTASMAMSNFAAAVLGGICRSSALPSDLGLGSAAGSAGDPSSIMWVADMDSDPAALADLGLVLYTYLAWMAQLVHGQQSRQAAAGAGAGRGRGSRQQQRRRPTQQQQQQQQQQSSRQLPAWHEDFLAAVHAPPRCNACDSAGEPQAFMSLMVDAVCQLSLHLEITTSCGDTSGPCMMQDVSLPARLDGSASGIESNVPVHETLLLLLEVMLLDQREATHMNCYKRIASFLHRSQSGDATATADALLQPVLQQLAPVVLGNLAAPASSSSRGEAASQADTSSSADDAKSEEFAALVEFLVMTGSSEALLAAYKQQPALTCKALELAVRIRHKAGSPALLLSSRDCLQHSSFAARVLRLCEAAAPAAAAAAAAQQGRQLFPLALSCLKHTSHALPSSDLTAAKLEAAAAAVAVGAKLGSGTSAGAQQPGGAADPSDTQNTTGAASSSSSAQAAGAAFQDEAGRMGLVLAAHGLLTAGQHMLSISEAGTAAGSDSTSRPAAALNNGESATTSGSGQDIAVSASAGSSSSAQQPHLAEALRTNLKVFNSFVAWLGSVLPAVELPGGPGSQQACAAARQQLLQLQRRLQQDLQDAVQVVNSSSSNRASSDAAGASSSTTGGTAPAAHELPPAVPAALPGLAEHLAAFGEALCAQFPLPHCCNNPGCVELRGASELQLVGGKGSVCSRCRTARYCCRQCQLDHLKDHKRVCKRIAGQQAGAAAGQG